MSDSPGEGKISRQDLERILKTKLGSNLIVEGYKSTYHTKPGENYGSVMLALDIIIRHGQESPLETLHLVAKFPPPTEFLQVLIDFKTTFCNEMNMYKLLRPELCKLQEESGIPDEEKFNTMCKYYGARTSLEGDQDPVADTDAVLLLENLKVSGYQMADRPSGLDLKHCELALSKLAQFHALPIALKLKKPEVFKQAVLKATADFSLGDAIPNPDAHFETLIEVIPECMPYITRMRNLSIQNLKFSNKSLKREPFATITHNDLWVNNLMFLYNNGDCLFPVDVRLVDFQVLLHCSPARDLIFFLFTSSADGVISGHYDHLINLYYTNFINVLKRAGCDTSVFSFDRFLSEIDEFAPIEFYHTLFVICIIYMDKCDVNELCDIGESGGLYIPSNSMYKRKVLTLIEKFDSKGWLK